MERSKSEILAASRKLRRENFSLTEFFRGLKSETMVEITLGWKRYRLSWFTGEVTGMGKDFVIYTIGQSMKGYFSTKSKAAPVVKVETKAKMFDYIFLRGAEGEEQSICLRNFELACREGHIMTIVWAIRFGKEHKQSIAVLNNSTGQSVFSEKELAKMFRPPIVFHLVFILGFFFTGFVSAGYTAGIITAIVPGYFASGIIAGLIAKPGIRRFKTWLRA